MKTRTKPPLWYTIQAIVGTLLEEFVLVVVVLWVLPIYGIHLSWWWLAVLVVTVLLISYLAYRIGRGTFFVKRKVALEALVGSEGKVVKPLSPVGYVKVRGELWKASSSGGELSVGDDVVVVGADRLMLIVRPKDRVECSINGL